MPTQEPPKQRSSSNTTTTIPASGTKALRTLCYWCFLPGLAMEQLAKLEVRSIILTSGTLNPLDSFASELRIPFPVRLENQVRLTQERALTPSMRQLTHHTLSVWPCGAARDRRLAGAGGRDGLGRGRAAAELVVPAAGREGVPGRAGQHDHPALHDYPRRRPHLLRLIRCVPLYVHATHHPSYPALHCSLAHASCICLGAAAPGLMDGCVSRWRQSGLWSRLQAVKLGLVEPRESSQLNAVIGSFDNAITSGRGAVLLAVCRGKVSEGVDFSDARARAVIITGIPFPPARDPKVELKRKHLDKPSYLRASVDAHRLRGEQAPTTHSHAWPTCVHPDPPYAVCPLPLQEWSGMRSRPPALSTRRSGA